jgi:hypothetical protein
MYEPETFLTELYVWIDEQVKADPPPERPGPPAALSPSEVATLAIYAQWSRFRSEADFYRHAATRLRPLFPRLPSRPQFNRQVRAVQDLITRLAPRLAQALAQGDERAYEVLDGTGVATRNAKRRGRGWLPGVADIGYCSRLGWYEGVRLLVSVTPRGGITGWGLSAASTNDRTLAETLLALRATPHPAVASVGQPTSDRYIADMGFSGRACQARWGQAYGATVVSPPQSDSRRAWPKPWRRWLARLRQVIESVNDRVLGSCGLTRLRPHTLAGLLARVAAAVALHNFCCWLNQRDGRGWLAFAQLINW